MKFRVFALLAVLALSGPVQTQNSAATASDSRLPAVSWTCPMHPDVVEPTKGSCPICKMTLVPVRLVTVWTCPVHGVIAEDHPGKCRICSRDLVQTTRALTFTCTGHPEINQLERGHCAGGEPMIAKYTLRPHGDHNPKHGGLFFMAPDNWHHVEGAYPGAGRFRLYVYDDFSKPLAPAKARKVRARVVTKETFDPVTHTSRELASAPLVLAKNGAFFEARIEPLAPPAQMSAKVSFSADDKESRFDFTFPAFSKDIPSPVSPPTSSGVAAPAVVATNPDGPTAALLADLKSRDDEVAALVRSGNFGGIYVPALQAKDLALQIQSRQGSSPDKQAVEGQVKQLVAAAYQLDNYGDLGDSQKISEAYRRFTAAVSALSSLFEAHP